MRVASAIVGIGVLLTAACGATANTSSASVDSGQPERSAVAPATTAQKSAGAEAAATLTVMDLDDRMKKIGTAAASLRMQLTANQLLDAAKQAQDVALWFGDVEKFWAQNRRADAVAWSQAARRAATDAAGAAAGNDPKKALAATTTLEANCSMCHSAYREGDTKSGFRIKAGAVR
jgi:hypothetical protein